MTEETQNTIADVIDATEDIRDPLEGLVERTATDPGAPFAQDALAQLVALKKDDRASFEALRAQLKSEGCRVTALDEAIAEENGDTGRRGPTQADILIDLAQSTELFHAPDGTGYADLDINGHRETRPTEADILAAHLACRRLKQSEINHFMSQGVSALALGVPLCVVADRVVFSEGAVFDFARDVGEDNAVGSLIIGVLGTDGLIDLVAWEPQSGRMAPWHGRAFALGEGQVGPPQLQPLPVWRSPKSWLRAHRHGIVIVKPQIAWARLADVHLLAEDVEHGMELRRLLEPPRARTQIFVPAKHVGAAA